MGVWDIDFAHTLLKGLNCARIEGLGYDKVGRDSDIVSLAFKILFKISASSFISSTILFTVTILSANHSAI